MFSDDEGEPEEEEEEDEDCDEDEDDDEDDVKKNGREEKRREDPQSPVREAAAVVGESLLFIYCYLDTMETF